VKRVVPGLAAVALIPAGCSDNNDSGSMPGMSSGATMPGMSHTSGPAMPTSVTPGDYNDADVTFLQMMYPHHAQAVIGG
jgi:uncharacterized protein (DUF305 family)